MVCCTYRADGCVGSSLLLRILLDPRRRVQPVGVAEGYVLAYSAYGTRNMWPELALVFICYETLLTVHNGGIGFLILASVVWFAACVLEGSYIDGEYSQDPWLD